MKAETEFVEGLARAALGWAEVSKRGRDDRCSVRRGTSVREEGSPAVVKRHAKGAMAFKRARAHPGGLDVDLVGELGVG